MNYTKVDAWSRREFLRAATVAGTAGFLGFGSEAAEAQQPARIPRIGILLGASASSNPARVEAFRQRLRELGYVEGKTLSFSTDMQKGNSTGCLTL